MTVRMKVERVAEGWDGVVNNGVNDNFLVKKLMGDLLSVNSKEIILGLISRYNDLLVLVPVS